MKCASLLIAFITLFGAEAFTPQSQKTNLAVEFKKAAASTFAALTIGSSILTSPMAVDAVEPFAFSSTNVVAEKVVRQGLYQDYEVDIVQSVDDAASTFKSAKETKSKKGKYTAILAILVVGAFIIPMGQYFWYVRDDSSSDDFFAEEVPEPPAKKKWF